MYHANIRSPTLNRCYNEHYFRNPRNTSRSVIPHRITSDSQSPSSYKRNRSPTINKIAENLEEAIQAASLDNSMTDENFLDYCNLFNVGTNETINTLDGSTKPCPSCCIPLKVPSKKRTQKLEKIFPEVEFVLNTGATISILNSLTRNAIKTQLHQSKYEHKIDPETKLGTANVHLISTKGMVDFTLLPLRDHSASSAVTFSIGDTKSNTFWASHFLQLYCKSNDTEHSLLVLKYFLKNTANIHPIPTNIS